MDCAVFRQLSFKFVCLLFLRIALVKLILIPFIYRVTCRSFCSPGHCRGNDGQGSDRKDELGQRFKELRQWQEFE